MFFYFTVFFFYVPHSCFAFTISKLDRLEQQQQAIADTNRDAIDMMKLDKPQLSPTRKKRVVSPATEEAPPTIEEKPSECKEEEPPRPNAFEVLKRSTKRNNLYNVDSIAHLTIEQVVKDYYEYKLDRTASFLKTGKDIDKNISMIRLVVKFSICVAQQSLENGERFVHQVQSPMPPTDSPDFIQWRTDRDSAALKIRAHAMKRMQEIEQQIKEMSLPMKPPVVKSQAKTNNRKIRTPAPPKPVVGSLYGRIDSATKTGFVCKVNFLVTKAV